MPYLFCQLPRTAITNYHSWVAENNGSLCSLSSGGQKCEIKVLASLVPSGGSSRVCSRPLSQLLVGAGNPWNCLAQRSLSAHSVMSNSLRPRGLYLARHLCPWDFSGKNTGVSCHFLLPGIFPTQGSNLCLQHGRQIFKPAEPPGKPGCGAAPLHFLPPPLGSHLPSVPACSTSLLARMSPVTQDQSPPE